MSGSIHKEALADAKKLREIAEANARNAIMEQITPTIKNMIEKELLGESALNEAEMEEDVLISPEEREEEEEDKGEKEEGCHESEEEIQLTVESVKKLAEMASAKAEHYGVRSLRLSEKLENLHESEVSDATYGEKLRQVKNEIEKTYTDLQEDKRNNIVPEETSQLIEGKLDELWGITNNLMIPVKVRLISESSEKVSRKFRGLKLIAKEYGLTKEAKKSFMKECSKLTKNARTLLDSAKELNEIAEDKKVNYIYQSTKGLFEEIYKMAKKLGSLNEEELKIVISGLDTDDLEGSALSAMVEPADDLDDMDMDDDMDMGMDDDLDMDDDMDMGGEDALDELLGGQSYKAGRGGLGKSRKGGARSSLSPEEHGAQMKRGEELARKEKEARERGEIDEDEMLEISEAMLKQELLRLKKRRSAINEAMKAMQHSPGGGPGGLDNFGGAGRQMGGGVEGDLFLDTDSNDVNELDPVGTGYPVNESEDALDELLGGQSYKAGKGGLGKTRRGGARKNLSPEEHKAQSKRGEELARKEKEARAKGEIDEAVGQLSAHNKKLQKELAESNLRNAKLVFATKLLQNQNLSENQRLVVVEELDNAKSVREVKKLYTALREALTKSDKGNLTESRAGRNILGGSSKPTKPGASKLTESEEKEFTRWGELAGFLNG